LNIFKGSIRRSSVLDKKDSWPNWVTSCASLGRSEASDLAAALKRGLAHHGVSLIEVMVDSAVPVLYARKS